MKTNKINFLIIISLILLIISIVFLTIKYINNQNIQNERSLIETTIKNLNIMNEKNGEKEILEIRKEFSNNDITAILKVSDIINTPIVQTNNNDYYLKYGLNKKRMPGGSVFIDYRTNINNRQINIYGHNSTKYDIPFRKLENYLKNDFTESNNIVELKTMNEIRIYQIFSVAITKKTSKSEHYYFEYSTDNNWIEHFRRLKDISQYKNDITFDEDDEIIVLQTCLFKEYKNKFLVISAKRIK